MSLTYSGPRWDDTAPRLLPSACSGSRPTGGPLTDPGLTPESISRVIGSSDRQHFRPLAGRSQSFAGRARTTPPRRVSPCDFPSWTPSPQVGVALRGIQPP